MTTTIELRDNPEALAEVVRDRQAKIIAIDGCDGAGKATLTGRLIELLGGKDVYVDDHINKSRGRYVAELRPDDLKRAIDAAHSSPEPVFIRGICLHDVLSRIGVDPDLVVYVERRSPMDLPCEWDILECEEDGDVTRLDEPYFTDLNREIGRYHRDFKPRSRADVIFLRHE